MRAIRIKTNKKNIIENIFNFCINRTELYFTKDNKRVFIDSEKQLKYLLKNSNPSFLCLEEGDIHGIVLLWKAKADDKERYYIKIDASNEEAAECLITVLLWNTDKKEIFIKIKKESFIIPILKLKGFKFYHDRGKEILLRRKTYVPNTNITSNNR